MYSGLEPAPGASMEEVLAHYGVLGMHWGVHKKEEPKPMSARRAAKVKKLETKASIMSTKISDLRKANEGLSGVSGTFKKFGNNLDIKNYTQERDRLLKDADAKRKHKLTSTQKKILIGGAVAAVLVGGVLLANAQQTGALNSYQLRAEAFLKGKASPFAKNEHLASEKLSVDQLLKDVAKPVNPGYSSPGGKMNCRRSTFAYELRRRGYDVHATTSAMGAGQSDSGLINAVTPGGKKFYDNLSVSSSVVRGEQAYQNSQRVENWVQTGGDETLRRTGGAVGDTRKNPIVKTFLTGLSSPTAGSGPTGTVSSSKKVLEELAKQPDRARGEVLFNFGTFGHSMAYELVDGVPHIFDSQKGTVYNAAHMVESKWDGFNTAEITRLDNVDLDLKFLTRWADNMRGK